MKLSELKKIINISNIINYKSNKYFSSITSNSKLVDKNSIFFYDNTSKTKKKYLKEAIANKASAIVTNYSQNNINIPQFIVKDIEQQKKLY